ncbi:uncharacterized protein LOC133886294 [Phragmites australis]|uniref:uncharacterized protein LOC133886294 n=1 Tax=Phragmites australis TaxID=29695 RepID=UPI002D776868|nr:uncharacterized protein LOC133886294 [Phragmites australis]
MARHPLIRPDGEKNWLRVGEGDHSRHVNGILGLLIKEKFPGMVTLGGVTEPAYTWAHYAAAPDARDREGRVFPNRAERVKAELWDFFRCEPGLEARAAAVIDKAAKKLVKDMCLRGGAPETFRAGL